MIKGKEKKAEEKKEPTSTPIAEEQANSPDNEQIEAANPAEAVPEPAPLATVQAVGPSEENVSLDDIVSTPAPAVESTPRLVDDSPAQPFALFDPALKEVGRPDDLEIPGRIERKKIISLIAEVAEVEGPVKVDDLAAKVIRCFGVEEGSEQMLDLVVTEIPPSRLRNSGEFGVFVWPDHLDPNAWNGFRKPGARYFDSLPPEEIVNASRFVLDERGPLGREDLVDATAHILGSSTTKEVRASIGRAVETGVA